MSILRSAAGAVYHQSMNLAKTLLGKPLTTPSLGSMTLDQDDVQLASHWLKQPADWYDQELMSRYESEFAHWNGSSYAFSFMGGRVALSACIYALDLKPGDQVILPGYTCVVVPNAFQFAGIETVYSDIELDTYGLDVTQLEAKISRRTKAILLHHLYGLVCRDYEPVVSLARKHGLAVIEDCAQSTGAEYKGRKVGNLGDVAIFSSEQSKVFTTVQGGLAVTNCDGLASRIREYQEQAPYPDRKYIDRLLHTLLLNYYVRKDPQRWWRGDLANVRYGGKRLISTTLEEEAGIRPAHYGSKMPAPVAGIGLNQLEKIDSYNERRRETATRWDTWCEENGYEKAYVVDNSVPVYLRYPILVEPQKKRHRGWARSMGVEPGLWFVSQVHPTDRIVHGCPAAERAVKGCIQFPSLLEDVR